MINNLRNWVLKFGINKIPLVVKPSEEAKFWENLVETESMVVEKKE